MSYYHFNNGTFGIVMMFLSCPKFNQRCLIVDVLIWILWHVFCPIKQGFSNECCGSGDDSYDSMYNNIVPGIHERLFAWSSIDLPSGYLT